MLEIADAQFVARRIVDHEMLSKLLESDMKALLLLKISFGSLDVALCDFFDVEICSGEKMNIMLGLKVGYLRIVLPSSHFNL